MNRVWAVVPAKPLGLGKSRLAGALSARERRSLNERLLRHVLETVITVVGAAHTVVVSRDPVVRALAKARGAQALCERGRGGLNRALAQGARWAGRRGADATLLVHGDLPRLSAAELGTVIAAAGRRASVVAAPDRALAGTNAMLLSPPDAIPLRFGPHSLRRHREAARRRHCRWTLVRAPGLAFDVDRPADYRALGRGAARIGRA
jgi:2-phospho-L-lactate guanylyltransferase